VFAASIKAIPASRISFTSRSCNVPNARSTRPLACGRLAQMMSIFSAASARPNCVTRSFLAGNRGEGREHVSLAVVIDPDSSGANFQKGALLITDGHHGEGRTFILKTIRHDPRGPQSSKYLSLLACSYYFEHDYEGAAEVARRLLVRYPGYPRAHRWLAAALGQLGRADEARSTLDELIRLSPTALESFVQWPWVPEDHEHLLDGLRKAGWQG
jgi:adenylate cyclase